MIRESPAISDRISDQQDDDVDAAVAAFALDPSLERLEVVQSHFGLDPDDGAHKAALRVPRTQITRDWKWHLSPPLRLRRYLNARPLQEARVSGISDWIGVGIWSRHELETNCGARERQLCDRHAWQLPALNSPEHRFAHSYRASGGTNAHTRATAREPNLGTGSPCDTRRLLTTSVEAPLTSRHRRILAVIAYQRANSTGTRPGRPA